MTSFFKQAHTNVHVSTHAVLGTNMRAEAGAGQEVIYLAAGCFWGVEKALWNTPGVITTATGYMGGHAIDSHIRAGVLAFDGSRGDRARRLRHRAHQRC